MRIVVLVLLLLFPLITSAASIEDLMSAPHPYSLVSARNSDRIAWIFNHRGQRNIWVAEGPEYRPRQITNYNRDDGQEISELNWSEDGNFLIYVRGGEPNSAKEIPNPASDPKGAKQEVWMISVTGGNPVWLGEGASPAVSRDGKTVVFVKDDKIYHNSTASPQKEPQLLFHARGRNGSPVFSPDGGRLTFVSNRGDHSFIGVYDLNAQALRWIAPDVDIDFNPVWSPDGSRIAFFRFPGNRGELLAEQELAAPFAIWTADANTGVARAIWTSSDNSGGFAQEYPHHPLMWAEGDRLLFYWEKDGWMRMYSISASGGDAVALSPANCEAEDSSLTNDKQVLLFSSNCKDIDRRHVWSVSVRGGTAKQLTSGDGIEWSPVPAGSNIAILSSNARQPAAPAVIAQTGGKPRLLAAQLLKTVPMQSMVIPQQAIFEAADGLKIHGQLFIPQNLKKDQRLPAVIFMHGGPIRQMLLGWHYRGYYHNTYAMNQYLATNGFVVLSVNFRSGIGYGRAFRRAENQGPRGASEYQDILAAAEYLRKRPDVDPNRIGLWGGSYGGYLTALGLARHSSLFAAGVDFHGVHDWSLRAKISPGDWGIVGDELMKSAFDSSPVASVALWTSPVLFVIGDDDRNVDFIETTDLVQRLREQDKAHVETLIFPDEVHSFLRFETWIRAFRATLEFFQKHL